VANSKQFEQGQNGSFPIGYSIHGGGGAPISASGENGQLARGGRQQTPCLLHLLQSRKNCNKCQQSSAARPQRQSAGGQQHFDDDSIPSFRNPYFSPSEIETVSTGITSTGEGRSLGKQTQTALDDGALLLRTAPNNNNNNHHQHQETNLHYAIESHIANLHSRQVTSSVQELDESISSAIGK